MTEQDKADQLGARFGRFVVRWRWALIAATLLVGFAAAAGGQKLVFNQDYRVFFSEDNPELQAFEAMQDTYTKSDTILFTVIPDAGIDAFDPRVLDAIEQITEQGWQLPYSLRVDSVTNYQHTVGETDDLIVGDLIEGATTLDAQTLQQARDVAITEPALADQLIATNGAATGVLVTFQMPGESMTEMPEAAAAARAIDEAIEADYPVTVHLTGVVMLNNAFFDASMLDMSTLVPAMYLIIIVVTFLLVRSFTATLGTVVVLFMSVGTAMGLAGWLGIQLTPPSSAAPTIIMTLAVADSIHFLTSMLAAMRKGFSKRDAIVESLRVNLQPIFLTSITTAVGFLSLNFSDAPPFGDLGNITAIGVLAAFFYSVILLPALLAVLPVRVKQSNSRLDRSMDRIADFVVARRRPVLLGSIVVAAALLALIPQNELNDDFVGYFDESVTFRQATDTTVDKLTGIYQLQFSLPAADSNGISDPQFLREVDEFTGWLRRQEEVRHVNSITDTFKRLNKNLHADDPSFYRLPEDRNLAAQYLLLYELSLPYGLDLNNQLNVDKSSTRVIATLDDLTSQEMISISKRAERWLTENTSMNALGVGPAIMFAYISERNINSMITGTLVAILVIAAIIVIALRSLKIGAISLIPNLLPAGIAFGVWGALVGEVNVAVSMVMGMTLGIVVDDSVHFLSKYLRGKREHGYDAPQAVRYAFSQVGTALLVTSLILVAGFSVLAQSTFAMNSYMAMLTAIAVAVALIADFLLLPTLLMLLDPARDRKTEPTTAVAARVATEAAGS